MPKEEDILFLRAAVEARAIEPAVADEVLAALEQVESLGATASAREMVVHRGLMTPGQVEQVLAACGLKSPTPARATGRIGNFEIVGRLGVGGMGVVLKARQVTVDRLVAVKVLPPRLAKAPGFVARFIREARAVAALNHPNIVQILEVGEADGVNYFAMELVDGETLGERIRRTGRLPEREALGIIRQIATALDHANTHGIIHRDVKPDNILLTETGVAKLADLGLAQWAQEGSGPQFAGPLGTPLYMSPEQVRSESAIDIRADIYSLGATLYHAVVGSPPFVGPTSAAIRAKHLSEKVPWPRGAVPELSEGICHVLLKMLAKPPEGRYATPAQLIEDIDRLLAVRAPRHAAPRPSTAVRAQRVRRHRSRRLALLAAAALALIAGGAWLVCRPAAATGRPAVSHAEDSPRKGPVPAGPRKGEVPSPATAQRR